MIKPPYSVGTGLLSLGVKWPGCEVNHSPSSKTKVKNEWSYTCSPSIRLHAVDNENYFFFNTAEDHHLITAVHMSLVSNG